MNKKLILFTILFTILLISCILFTIAGLLYTVKYNKKDLIYDKTILKDNKCYYTFKFNSFDDDEYECKYPFIQVYEDGIPVSYDCDIEKYNQIYKSLIQKPYCGYENLLYIPFIVSGSTLLFLILLFLIFSCCISKSPTRLDQQEILPPYSLAEINSSSKQELRALSVK